MQSLSKNGQPCTGITREPGGGGRPAAIPVNRPAAVQRTNPTKSDVSVRGNNSSMYPFYFPYRSRATAPRAANSPRA